MKRKIIISLCVFVALILLFPIPMEASDGGTVRYQAVLYSVTNIHTIYPDETSFLTGTVVEILGFEVFNNVPW